MELLTLLAASIPQNYRALTIALLVAAYFGIPFLRERNANRVYWEFRERQLKLLDLAGKAPATANQAVPKISPDLELELEAQRVLLKPDLRPQIQRAAQTALVAVGAILVLIPISLLAVFSGQLSVADAVFFAAVPQALVALLLTLPLRSTSRIGALLLGVGTGLFVHALLIVVTAGAT